MEVVSVTGLMKVLVDGTVRVLCGHFPVTWVSVDTVGTDDVDVLVPV